MSYPNFYLNTNATWPLYGCAGGITSLNFRSFAWAEWTDDGRVRDPCDLLGGKFDDPDLVDAPDPEDERVPIAHCGAAMVAYGLLQSSDLSAEESARLRHQLLRYYELDTLAMVMAWEGLQELLT